MGLFSRKKPIQPTRLPEFPQFPQNPSVQQNLPRVEPPPTYEPQFKPPEQFPRPLTQPVALPRPEPTTPAGYNRSIADRPSQFQAAADIPRREHVFTRPEIDQRPPLQPLRPEPERLQQAVPQAQPLNWGPPPRQEQQEPRPAQPSQDQGERPMFVKIQEYREAMASIDVLKQKIRETESLLERIEQIRTQEQNEMTSFRDNLNKMKEKLMSVDKRLFEA